MKENFFGLMAAIGLLLTAGTTDAAAKSIKDEKGKHKIESAEMRHKRAVKAAPRGKHNYHKREMHAHRPVTLRDHRTIERYHKHEIRKHKKALKRNQAMRRMHTHYDR